MFVFYCSRRALFLVRRNVDPLAVTFSGVIWWLWAVQHRSVGGNLLAGNFVSCTFFVVDGCYVLGGAISVGWR